MTHLESLRKKMQSTKQNNMKKLSVIIPFYNVEDHIERCIKSLLNEITDDVELIFIDDCGPDNSAAIVKKYQENNSQIIYVKNEQNMKLGPSRIEGLKIAKGQWITFVDSDDFVTANYYESLFKNMTDNANIVLFNYNRVDEEENLIYTYKGHCFKNDQNFLYKSDPASWNKMYKKDILEALPSFNTYVEDVALWPTIIDRVEGKYVISRDVIYNYVANPNSLTANVTTEKRMQYYENFDYIFANNDINDGLLIFAYQHLFYSQVGDLSNPAEIAFWHEKSDLYLTEQFGSLWKNKKVIKAYNLEKKIVAIKKRLPMY